MSVVSWVSTIEGVYVKWGSTVCIVYMINLFLQVIVGIVVGKFSINSFPDKRSKLNS